MGMAISEGGIGNFLGPKNRPTDSHPSFSQPNKNLDFARCLKVKYVYRKADISLKFCGSICRNRAVNILYVILQVPFSPYAFFV